MNYSIYKLIIQDFAFIPIKLRQEKRFCLWRYEKSNKSRGKNLKKPYGIDCANKIVPSLKDTKYWFGLQKLNQLKTQLIHKYGLGLILNDGPYTVIDLDNCFYAENNQLILLQEAVEIIKLFPDAYIELSPSNTGLHIIFRGEWLVKCNKASKYISPSLEKGTIEIYSGHNCRYITLTGNSIFNSLIEEDLPYYSFHHESLQKLYKDFFSMFALQSDNTLHRKAFFKFNLDQQNALIRQKILHSKLHKIYSDLCISTNPGYLSPSEADWSFCLLVLEFLPKTWSYENKFEALKSFFLKYRAHRDKNNKQTYLSLTVNRVLKYYELKSMNGAQIQSGNQCANNFINNRANKKAIIAKENVLRVCNTMQIFHLGRSVKNTTYLNENRDNYLKATIPYSLNQTDFAYYMQVLFQYVDQIKQISVDNFKAGLMFPINVNEILKNLGKTKSGRSYLQLKKSLEKISAVHLVYDKKISLDNRRCTEVGSLLSFKYIYDQEKLTQKHQYKSLFVSMHPIIVDLIYNGSYNYSILNRESYSNLKSSKHKLLYYFLSLKTLPGKYPVNLSLDNILELWPDSNCKKAIDRRRKEAVSLLVEMLENYHSINDLDIDLIKSNNNITAIQVKKRTMQVV